MKCCLCGKEIEKLTSPKTGEIVWDQGNSAWPLADGRCCKICDETKVIPARYEMGQLKEKNPDKKFRVAYCEEFALRGYTGDIVGHGAWVIQQWLPAEEEWICLHDEEV